ncbi:hypothetical protein [Vitiosangium sp. GDMCC 1.1324]|uniref:hypothetical protein n=1 Tax=Vitiosangium sp. (strain GDMCC 1.1324) TaxID=2138576 RepID=UPI000D3A8C58|nr:hypothetical protein [Vitiosangium sp. GDMCC 1.1324]PTL85908.1 hypothetical protein DAT35_04255 [Vitiosangium sp. GDMCC 1.1324]
MMDTHIDQRFKRTWDFFLANVGGLLLGGLVVLAGWLVIIPGPWFSLNLLQETLECARSGRPVRWQATFERQGNFVKSWGLTLAMGIPLAIGYALLIVPGVLLSLYWFHAPMLAADGRKTLDALSESGRIFRRRNDWAAYFLNWLVLAVLSALGGVTAFALLLTVPLSLAYLAFCYTDEVGTVPTVALPRREVVV